jgi:hypothetical protein
VAERPRCLPKRTQPGRLDSGRCIKEGEEETGVVAGERKAGASENAEYREIIDSSRQPTSSGDATSNDRPAHEVPHDPKRVSEG